MAHDVVTPRPGLSDQVPSAPHTVQPHSLPAALMMHHLLANISTIIVQNLIMTFIEEREMNMKVISEHSLLAGVLV